MSKLKKGIQNPRAAIEYVGTRILWWAWRRHQITHLYDRDWDVAIVLDACRCDLFQSANWTVPKSVEPIYSVASMTGDWMERTFPEDASDTVYVTSAPFSDEVLDAGRFGELDEVWRYAFDEEIGTVLPDWVTDRAIVHGRQGDYQRLVVHYMQPHFPSIPYPELGSELNPTGSGRWHSVWERSYHGDLSRERVWEAYRSNLDVVLEEVEVLLENLDADRVVVTSDHGNAMGAAGRYGHPKDAVIPGVRRVPWALIGPTTDQRNRIPSETRREPQMEPSEGSATTKERLAALGYV